MSNTILNYSKGLSLYKLINEDGVCKICQEEFSSGSGLSMHLRKKHNITFKEYLKKYFEIDVDEINKKWNSEEEKKKRKENSNRKNSSREKLNLKGDKSLSELINFDYKCKICGKTVSSTSNLGKHLTKHNITFKEYLKKYFQIDVDEINKKWNSEEEKKKRKEKQLSGWKKYAEKNKGKTFLEINGKDSYLKLKKSMRGVFSKEWFIKKYGEIEGREKYKERSGNLSKNTYWKKYNKKNKENYSNISQELFWEIYNRINKNQVYFGELNHEFGCGTNTNFDFVVVDNKKIIEFNGDKWHANPKLYESSDIPLKFLGSTAKEIWDHDKNKIKKAKDKGYDIKIIWESDYLKNKEKIILECIDFINEYENS